MLDPLWDIQLSSDHRVSEQGDLSQGEAVGGQPVGEHRLRFDGEQNYFRQLKSKFFRVFMMFKLRLTHYGKKKNDASGRQTDRGEVDGEGEDDERHDPEHCLHGAQVGVVDTGLCAQLQEKPCGDYYGKYTFNHR